MRHIMGWDYPAGAANDPNAPWNQEDTPDSCPICGKENLDEEGSDIYDGIFCSETCEIEYESREIGPEPPDDAFPEPPDDF